MRYTHLEDHFDIDNDGALDFMEKSMMDSYVWETFRAEEEGVEEDDYCTSREKRDLAYMDREDMEDIYGEDYEDFDDDDW